MPDLVIVDTDVLIEVSREVMTAVSRLSEIADSADVGTSVITQMELIVGCRNKEEQQITAKFLGRFRIIHLNWDISRRALDLLSAYRLSHGLLIADALIASTAIQLRSPLFTKNRRHYRFIQGLELLE